MNSNQDKASVENIEVDDVIFDEISLRPVGDPKLLQGLPKTEAFTGYKVQIDEANYFALDGFILRLNGKEIRIFNLRSIRGCIGVDFTRKGDKSLGKIIMDYLTRGDNVELLNILSREINGFNWFEAYSDDFIDLDLHTKEELMGMKNSGSMIIPPWGDDIQEGNKSPQNMSIPPWGDALQEGNKSFSRSSDDIIDIKVFKAEVRSQHGQDGHLLPQALMNHLHEGVQPYVKLSPGEFTYFPIWYINGARTSNADYCELYCPLEVIVHILSKRFVQFKAKLLTLASTDMQLAVEKGERLDDYTSLRRNQLIEACHAKDDKIDELIKTVTKQTETIIQQTSTIQDQSNQIHTLTEMNIDQSNKIEELKNMNLNQMENLDSLIDLNVNMNGRLISMDHRMKHKDETLERLSKKVGWVVHDIGQMSMRQVVTDATEDILVLYTSQLKPIDKGRMPIAEHDQIWIASYNGDINNFKVPKVPEDANEIYRVPANRLNSFKKMIEDQNVKPFIISVYDRSILIHENFIDDFIQAVDQVLNEQGQFQSIIKLREIHDEIKQRKEERKIKKENEDYLEFKREVYRSNAKPKIIISSRRRVLYLKRLNDQGNETYVPLSECDIEEVAKSSWWYRWGSGGCHIDELDKTTILTSRYTSDPEPRIKYE